MTVQLTDIHIEDSRYSSFEDCARGQQQEETDTRTKANNSNGCCPTEEKGENVFGQG